MSKIHGERSDDRDTAVDDGLLVNDDFLQWAVDNLPDLDVDLPPNITPPRHKTAHQEAVAVFQPNVVAKLSTPVSNRTDIYGQINNDGVHAAPSVYHGVPKSASTPYVERGSKTGKPKRSKEADGPTTLCKEEEEEEKHPRPSGGGALKFLLKANILEHGTPQEKEAEEEEQWGAPAAEEAARATKKRRTAPRFAGGADTKRSATPEPEVSKTDDAKIRHEPETTRNKDEPPKDNRFLRYAVLYPCATKGGLDVTDQKYQVMGKRRRGAWASHYAGKAWTRQVHSVGAQLYPNMPVNEIDWSVYTDTGRTNIQRAVALNIGWPADAYMRLVIQDGELQPFMYPINQSVLYGYEPGDFRPQELAALFNTPHKLERLCPTGSFRDVNLTTSTAEMATLATGLGAWAAAAAGEPDYRAMWKDGIEYQKKYRAFKDMTL